MEINSIAELMEKVIDFHDTMVYERNEVQRKLETTGDVKSAATLMELTKLFELYNDIFDYCHMNIGDWKI